VGKIPIPEENVKFIVNDLTPERILRHIDIEDRFRGAAPDEVLQKLPDAMLKSFSREDLKRFLKILSDKITEDER